jgi:hypothetical protein
VLGRLRRSEVFFHGFLIEIIGVSLRNLQSAGWTIPDAGPEAVAVGF